MSVNVLGNAWLQITPKWVGLDRMGSQLQQQIRVPMDRVGESIRDATGEATRLGGSLDDASAATRKAAVEAAGLDARMADVGDTTRKAVAGAAELNVNIKDVGGTADSAAGSIAGLRTGLDAAGNSADLATGSVTGIGSAAADAAGLTAWMAGGFDTAAAAASRTAVNVGGIGEAVADAASGASGLSTSLEEVAGGVGETAAEAAGGWEEAFSGIGESGTGAFSLLTGAAAAFGLGLEDAISDASRDAADASGDAAEETKSRWGRALEGIKANAGSLATAVAVAVAAAFTVGLKGTIAEQSRDILIQASLGVAPEEAARLGGIAGQLYAQAYGESLGEVTAAVGSVRHSIAGMATASSEDLRGVAARALSIAGAFGEEVVPTVTAVSQLIRSGLAKDSGEALDLIAAGFQKGANYGGDFLDALTKRAPNLKQFGFDGASAIGFIVQGLNAGADSADTVTGALDELIGNAGDSADVFTELGFRGEQMARDLSGGGPKAAKALDALLEKLRSMDDPAKRATAFVSLFGEEAAVFQSAILALDPSNAVAALGAVEGAAASLDAKMGTGTQAALTTIRRTFEAGLADLASVALPPFEKLVTGIAGVIGPGFDAASRGVKDFFSALGGTDVAEGGVSGMERLGGAVRDVAAAFIDGAGPGLRSFGDFVTGSLWPALKNLGGVLKNLWPDIQVVAGVVGGILLTAFNAVGWILANVVGPALSGLTGFIRDNQTWLTALAVAVGVGVVVFGGYTLAVTAASWATYLWASRTVIMGAVMRAVQGAMAAMRAAVLALNAAFWANPIGIVIALIIALAAGFAYLWTHSESFRNFWKAIWEGIKTATLAVVNALIAAYNWVVGALEWVGQKASEFFGFFVNAWRGGFTAVVNLVTGWVNVVQGIFTAVFGAIEAFFRIWWTAISTVFRVSFEVIRGIISFFVNIFRGDWEGAWNAIRNTTDRVLGIVRGAIDTVLGAIKGAFETAVRGIGKAWDGIKRIAAVPVNFVIGTVYNDGIRRAFNFVAGLIGVRELPPAPLIQLARGGRLAGYGGGDVIPALLEAGETVVDKDRTKMLAPIFAAAGVPGFKLGGFLGKAWDATGGRVVSGVADLAGNAVDWVRGALGSGLDAALGPVRAGIRAVLGTGEGWKGWLGKLALKPLDKLVEWVRGRDEAAMTAEVGSVGGGVQRWAGIAAAVLKELGQSLRWLPTLLRRMNQESGGNPRAINLWDINAKRGYPSQGLMQTIPQTFNAYAGPYRSRGILDPYANIYASTRYTLATYGSLAAWNRPGGYDNGGPLHPGWTLAYNGTGHDEYVVNPRRAGLGGVVVNSTVTVDARGSSDPAAVQRAVEAGVARGTAEMAEQLTVLLRAGAGAA